MIEDPQTREAIVRRLVRAGWATGMESLQTDANPNRVIYRMHYTAEGKQKMTQLGCLFHELGMVEGAHWGGELESLLILTRDQL